MKRKSDSDLAADLKATVALAALRGDKSAAQLAAEFGLDPEQIEQWKSELERNAAAAFRRDAPSSEAPTLPMTAPPAPRPDRPGLPTVQGQRSALQPSGRLRAPTLPTLPGIPERPVASPPVEPMSRTVGDEATLPQWPSGPKAPPLPQPARETLDDDYWGTETLPTSGVRARTVPGAAARPLPAAQASSPAAENPFRRLFVGWKEKHHAAATSRQLLKLYEKVAAERPGLKRMELYRRIVMARQGGTEAAADAVLVRATESFATWPVERALTFRDVVHYLAVSDYLASGDVPPEWARENLGRVVATFVPDNL